MVSIRVSVEGERGCGYRQPGGTYLVAPALGSTCAKLPIPLTTCPCCSAGIKFARGWTWVDGEKLCNTETPCEPGCPVGTPGVLGRCGLLWVGESFYEHPSDFTSEAARMGVSRRIQSVPHGFEVGKTWVLMAHIKAVPKAECRHCGKLREEHESNTLFGTSPTFCPDQKPRKGKTPKTYEPDGDHGIFCVFRPTAIEYVVKGDETQEDLEAIEKRGIQLVQVVRDTGAIEKAALEEEASAELAAENPEDNGPEYGADAAPLDPFAPEDA